ncbi:MAG TPA: precorrin-6A synthase (deacetylating) [Actinomycetales bacterium]|nr:precorrin-6A synthase (deacetylating) [Actinomycetales bacterium]
MRTVLVIGIGTGDPRHLTLAAVDALRRADVLLLLDKGEATEDMRELRRRIVAEHRPDGGPREVVVADPRRDDEVAAVDYDRAVADWHAERARRIRAALEAETGDDGVAAFLVWGDPALYDSTLRILDRARAAGAAFAVEVVPGVTAPAALTAAFGICANRVGEPLHITTGRRLAGTPPEVLANVVVMLDAHCAFRDVAGPDTHIWWGAYLGSPEQILVSGPALEVADEIVRVRAGARERHGWIMDTYLLRSGEGASSGV